MSKSVSETTGSKNNRSEIASRKEDSGKIDRRELFAIAGLCAAMLGVRAACRKLSLDKNEGVVTQKSDEKTDKRPGLKKDERASKSDPAISKSDKQANKEEKAPDALNPDKYLGIWRIKGDNYSLTANLSKSEAKKDGDSKKTIKLKNSDTADLISPIVAKGKLDYRTDKKIPFTDKYIVISLGISNAGGMYKNNKGYLIVLWESLLRDNIVLAVRENGGRIEASVPREYNSEKVSSKIKGWLRVK